MITSRRRAYAYMLKHNYPKEALYVRVRVGGGHREISDGANGRKEIAAAAPPPRNNIGIKAAAIA